MDDRLSDHPSLRVARKRAEYRVASGLVQLLGRGLSGSQRNVKLHQEQACELALDSAIQEISEIGRRLGEIKSAPPA